MIAQHTFKIHTQGRSTLNITSTINQWVLQQNMSIGLCHVFIHHTSASLILTENADPDVRKDLEYFMHSVVKDGDPNYRHQDEGEDDMSAHIRTVLTQSELTVPVRQGQLLLGTWQGVYCWEHRAQPHVRNITVTIQGE